MNKFLAALTFVFCFSAFAENQQVQPKKHRPAKDIIMRKTGGMVIKPGTGAGSFAFVNSGSKVSNEIIEKTASSLKRDNFITIEVKESEAVTPKTATEAMKKLGVNVAVFLTDCPDCPVSLLVAPEQAWAIVNARRLREGEGADDKTFAARVNKELVRAFAMVCGAMDSQGPMSLMRAVADPSDLDMMPHALLPVDVQMRLQKYPERFGLKPFVRTSYRQACGEGWAPAPTNQYQQAIWDREHQIPTKPMKIKFDPKTDK